MVPMSSPLTPPSGDAEETGKSGAVVKKLKVQAIKKDIKQVDKTSGPVIFLPNN
jgi:large subunit ribosomal protein L22